jgi:hypothetical protein
MKKTEVQDWLRESGKITSAAEAGVLLGSGNAGLNGLRHLTAKT